MAGPRYAHCLVPQAIARLLTYLVPAELAESVRPGVRVRLPLRRGSVTGIVLKVDGECPAGIEPKSVGGVTCPEPLFDAPMLEFLQWVADYYLAPAGLVLRAALPAPLRKTRERRRKGPELPAPPERDTPPPLSPAQEAALEPVAAAVDGGKHEVFLLHGVTSSGKTEIYLRAAGTALAAGKSAIVLVPEIALSYQVVELFRARFGRVVSVLHSRLTGAERARAVETLRAGPRIVIGARSAIFAPAVNPGLIVVDEEHEAAYKQEDAVPFYHAVECALVRAKLHSCPLVLGSATPSLESAARGKGGAFRLLSLPERIDSIPLPRVEVSPMAAEPFGTVIGARLRDVLRETVERGEQALLFLNRRGFAPAVLCTSCGKPLTCTECSTSMVFHIRENALRCHWCGKHGPVPARCPSCNSTALKPIGIGTQKVEHEVAEFLPRARIVRMDRDTTRSRLAHRDLLDRFAEGDILVGTQMVAKGFDFPRLTAVGVILADVSMTLPDFRSAERTFQLLTQVAGRAGRRDRQGLVILQTFAPDSPVIRAAANHDYWTFYAAETAQRRAFGYPPFGRLVRFRLTGRSRDDVAGAAGELAKFVSARLPTGASVLGPAPACPAVVARKHRWHLLLKGKDGGALRDLGRRGMEHVAARAEAKGVQVSVDVNPLNVMS